MTLAIVNNKIQKTFRDVDEEFNCNIFPKTQNIRTFTSLDYCYLTYEVRNKIETNNYRLKKENYIQERSKQLGLSNQIEFKKIDLPVYFDDNKFKINKIYQAIKLKIDTTERVDECFNLLRNSISELNFYDVHLEVTKSNLIKITTLFEKNKILIMSKDVSETDTNIFYSYFINRQIIASDVAEISEFTKKFKEYLSL